MFTVDNSNNTSVTLPAASVPSYKIGRIKRRFLFTLALVLMVATSLHLNFTIAQELDTVKEQKYLPIVKQTLSSAIDDIDEYGSVYIDRTNGFKFVLSLSKEDLKTEYLKKVLQSQLPSDLLVFKKVKYSMKDLKSVAKDMSKNWKQYEIDGSLITGIGPNEEVDKVIIEAHNMTENTKAAIISQYGDKVKIDINTDYSIATPA